MFLKSLTLRGFKSFADKTELTFEPGVTVIVGPNGSGKSNIVDALAWVLGSSSPKSLRGGAMSDVIFAGAPGRPALGRTAVEITIDNSAGTLPIEFTEVTVSRSMFANGENSYAINGVECRALDVQELLSDTGLGREHHTIVGQGQLDAVLNAKPEERRAFIEEAAGILKHRRRKERALRKLSQMESHTERVADVLRELRRNLRPLERQAEAAAKHAEIQGALREVRLARALRELSAREQRWAAEQAVQERSDVHLGELEAKLAGLRRREAAIESSLSKLAPSLRAATEAHFRLSNLVERYRGLAERIEERRNGLVDAAEEPVAGRDPARLRADAAVERELASAVTAERELARGALEAAEAQRKHAEQARRAHEQAAAAEARRRAEARERLLRWEGEVSALRSALAQAASEEGRLASQVSGLRARKAELERDIAAVQSEIQRLDAEEVVLAEQLATAEALVGRRKAVTDAAARRERELERQRASLEARADALRAASQEATEGAAALVAAAEAGELHGVVGPLADHVQVGDGFARAVAGALGPLGDALVVSNSTAAADGLALVHERKAGRVLLLVSDTGEATDDAVDEQGHGVKRRAELADLGARPLVESLHASAPILAALRRALADVYVVADFEAAVMLAVRYPDVVFVTADGQVCGPRGWAGGSAVATSAVVTRAAAAQAESQLESVNDELLRAHRQLADADRQLEAARRELDAANAAMQESDGLITAAAERLKRLCKELQTAERELTVLEGQQADLEREITGQRERLTGLEVRGVPSVEPVPQGPDLEAERLDDALAEAREQEVQARLAVSALEQRDAELRRRVAGLEREADAVEQELAERERRRQARLAAIERCAELALVATAALRRASASLDLAAGEQDRLDDARAAQQRELGVVRAQLRALEQEHSALIADRHREDLVRQELRLAVEAARERLRSEFDLDPADALAAADAQTFAGGEERDTQLADEEERLVRKLALLGTINPLALQEYTALEERHTFLTAQLEDLKASRRDLLKVVEAVDARIREVFAAAFADVALAFERVFPRMFPGGEGRLVLTDPDNVLETGVDVEARPAGKRVKRLSLLSGGERSLTALAVLFAIFTARPSPFYVLDEVEAALDDVNLQRFLEVVAEFRATSQLLVITHQKRTMEIADALYGVTMQGNGTSRVVSQRMADPAPVTA